MSVLIKFPQLKRISSISLDYGMVINRCLSSNEKPKDFVKNRKVYNDEMQAKRKLWREQFDVLNKSEERRKDGEKRLVFLSTAIRLREKREESKIKQEQARLRQEAVERRFKEHLVKRQMIRDALNKSREQRYLQLKNDLNAEKEHWIFKDSISTKIATDLFCKPCSTGLVTKTSQHWRLHPITLNLKRKMSQEWIDQYTGKTFNDRKDNEAQIGLIKKMYVQEFLEPMIATGHERSNYKELVDEFTDRFSSLGGLEEVEWYWDWIRQNNESTMDMDDEGNYYSNDDEEYGEYDDCSANNFRDDEEDDDDNDEPEVIQKPRRRI